MLLLLLLRLLLLVEHIESGPTLVLFGVVAITFGRLWLCMCEVSAAAVL